jgi:hypothetical protein
MKISKRDYFAAAALTGLLARPGSLPAPEDVAAEAFEYADAMLKLTKTLLDPIEFNPEEIGKEEDEGGAETDKS